MTTTDTPYAAFLIDRGHELSAPVDYSTEKWVYEFDIEQEEEIRLRDIFRRQGFSNVYKLTVTMVKLAHGRQPNDWALDKWPTLGMAVRMEDTPPRQGIS